MYCTPSMLGSMASEVPFWSKVAATLSRLLKAGSLRGLRCVSGMVDDAMKLAGGTGGKLEVANYAPDISMSILSAAAFN